MKITGTAIKLGALSLVLLLFTAIIIVVFGQLRFDRTTGYSAEFSSASGLRLSSSLASGAMGSETVTTSSLPSQGLSSSSQAGAAYPNSPG